LNWIQREDLIRKLIIKRLRIRIREVIFYYCLLSLEILFKLLL
jgi:hypothetical protein